MSALSDHHGVRRERDVNRVRNYGPTDAPEDRNTDDEFKRRLRKQQAVAAAPAKVVAASPAASVAAAAMPPPPPPPPSTTIDRWHKEGIGRRGGYILISPDHDTADRLGQFPPFNSGYAPPSATASSIGAGLIAAKSLLNILRPGARISLLVASGDWHEDITFDVPGIDLCGWGTPQLTGHQTVAPEADTSIYDFELVAHDSQPALRYLPTLPPQPGVPYVIVPPGVYGSKVSGEDHAAWFQRRIYAEDSQFFQTHAPPLGSEDGAVKIETLGPNDVGWSTFFKCQINSYIDTSLLASWGPRPAGFAVEARALARGPFYIDGIAGDGRFIWPSSGVLFDECKIHGTVLCEQWQLKFRRCYGISQNNGPEVGGVFLLTRGQPLFDPFNFYFGDATAFVTLEHCEIHARILAEAAPWAGFKTGDPHPGRSDVFFRQSELQPDWNAPIGGSFFSSGGLGFASIIQSAGSFAGGLTWITSAGVGWVVGTFGDCPSNAVALADLYTI